MKPQSPRLSIFGILITAIFLFASLKADPQGDFDDWIELYNTQADSLAAPGFHTNFTLADTSGAILFSDADTGSNGMPRYIRARCSIRRIFFSPACRQLHSGAKNGAG
jgi:hypothetical protein